IGIAGFLVALIANGPTMSIIGEAIIGTGIALINIPTVNLLVLSIEQRDMGIATSMNSVFRFLGSALGAPIAGLLIATYESRTAFTISFILGILTMIATIIFAAQADEIFGKNRKVTKVEHEVSI
ncbi:MAG: MFS transporter, partial [Candidatus Micrarchaeota archaeon]|nr:MFS transporter [Candidatus Micrarchaeota archaeon]